MSEEPCPPENVCAVMAGGEEVPLECRYVGWRHGAHVWEAVLTLADRPREVRAGMIPAHTSIHLVWEAKP